MKRFRSEADKRRLQLLTALSRSAFEEDLSEHIDRIPVEMRPKKSENTRCCIYKDRAVIKYRLTAMLGYAVEEEHDETRTLASYAEERLANPLPAERPLTVIDIACHACSGGKHVVTDLCHGCAARACRANCPRGAVSFRDGRAVIDPDLCVNCGKCRESCPYNAVAFKPVPCEQACPVGAIAKGESGAAVIDWEKCISCGQCMRACPFNAVVERSSILSVISSLRHEAPVAMAAPSIVGQFPGTLGQIVAGLKALGFSRVVEVAAGAQETVEHETAEYLEAIAAGKDQLGTSCCPAYVVAVRKNLPDFLPLVSSAPTPLACTGAAVRKLYPGRPRVFIGPCVAKRLEAQRDASAEYVITFEELAALFIARGIDVKTLTPENTDGAAGDDLTWGFAVAGGVAKAVAAQVERQGGTALPVTQIDGLCAKTMRQLQLAADGKLKPGLYEVMACEGGCICGPGTIGNPAIVSKALDEICEERRKDVEVSTAV